MSTDIPFILYALQSSEAVEVQVHSFVLGLKFCLDNYLMFIMSI